MEKVFWDDPYQTKLITKIAWLEGNRFVPEVAELYSPNALIFLHISLNMFQPS